MVSALYSFNYDQRPVDFQFVGDGFTAEQCCDACWTTPDCVSWLWEGNIPNTVSTSCNVIVSTSQASNGITKDECENRILLTELLIEDGFEPVAFSIGPCDLRVFSLEE